MGQSSSNQKFANFLIFNLFFILLYLRKIVWYRLQ